MAESRIDLYQVRQALQNAAAWHRFRRTLEAARETINHALVDRTLAGRVWQTCAAAIEAASHHAIVASSSPARALGY